MASFDRVLSDAIYRRAPGRSPTPASYHYESTSSARSASASMAMSDTGSSFAQWASLYDPEPSAGFAAADGNADSPATIAAAASPTSAGSGGSPTKSASAAASCQPGIEGPRAGKPARRRSRASRRAPVTLLNTDTANFRAMVQQFTGIPAPPAGAFGGGPVISFAGGDYGFPTPPSGVMSFDHHHHLHHRSQQQHHQAPAAPLHDQLIIRRQQQQQQQQQYTGAAFGTYNSLMQGGDMFASAEDRLLLQSMQQAAQMPPASLANNSSLGFFA